MPTSYGPLLTRDQFLKTKTWRELQRKGVSPQAAYKRYRDYVVNTRTRRAQARTQSTAGLSGYQMSLADAVRMAGKLFPAYGQGVLRTRARNYVSAHTDPLIKQIRDSIQAQTSAGLSAIRDLTGDYARMIGGIAPQVDQVYQQAKGEQQAIGGALSGFLQSQGQALGGDVSAQLAAAGQETAPGAAVATLGQGAAGGVAAAGASGLERLIAQGAAESAYARLLPGFARQQGLQEASGFQAQMGAQLADEIGAISAQVPGMIENIYQQLAAEEAAKAQNRGSFVTGALDRGLQAALGAAGLDLDWSKFISGEAIDWAQVDNAAAQNNQAAGLSAEDIAGLRAQAFSTGTKLAQDILASYVDPLTGQPRPGAGQPQFNAIQRQVYEHLKGQLGGIVDDKLIRAMATQIVNSVGVFPTATGPAAPTPGQQSAGAAGAKGDREGQRPDSTKQRTRRPKPKAYPNAVWRENGPSGKGWYITIRLAKGGTALKKVG